MELLRNELDKRALRFGKRRVRFCDFCRSRTIEHV
jgi:hypothetical protein